MCIRDRIVTDHQSGDGTRDILEQYKKEGVILALIDEPGVAFDQVAWVHRMIELARDRYHADYCINSDADEFWYTASGSLRNELARSRAGKIPVSYTHLVLTNLFGTPRRVALGMGEDEVAALREVGKLLAFLKEPEPPKGWRDAWDKLPIFKKVLDMAPKQISRPPCQERVIEESLSLIHI